jgi:hypothetical protein
MPAAATANHAAANPLERSSAVNAPTIADTARHRAGDLTGLAGRVLAPGDVY